LPVSFFRRSIKRFSSSMSQYCVRLRQGYGGQGF
jgi:hypothetical protein